MANITKFEIFKQKLISKENVYEICFEVIGNPKQHPEVPHKHKWINGKRGKADEIL